MLHQAKGEEIVCKNVSDIRLKVGGDLGALFTNISESILFNVSLFLSLR